jgi:hypothetical protein
MIINMIKKMFEMLFDAIMMALILAGCVFLSAILGRM